MARLKVDLTERQADALHDVLSMVLNDPDGWEDQVDFRALAQVDTKVVRALASAAL